MVERIVAGTSVLLVDTGAPLAPGTVAAVMAAATRQTTRVAAHGTEADIERRSCGFDPAGNIRLSASAIQHLQGLG